MPRELMFTGNLSVGGISMNIHHSYGISAKEMACHILDQLSESLYNKTRAYEQLLHDIVESTPKVSLSGGPILNEATSKEG